MYKWQNCICKILNRTSGKSAELLQASFLMQTFRERRND
nr:MAG TPA: hypothetical protein [Caudoviricetes sp.]